MIIIIVVEHHQIRLIPGPFSLRERGEKLLRIAIGLFVGVSTGELILFDNYNRSRTPTDQSHPRPFLAA
ncbi:hypothetical protein [Pollutibacter soli]|uniref:hypothetical protein n=1 Tax=Pollutibacter soli TaxID=3034157 RepID=UPI0030133BB4